MVIVSMESTDVSGFNEHSFDNGNLSHLLVYAEFITSLSVANVYVGFDQSSTRFLISKITCNQQNIEVTVVDKAGSICYQPISKDNHHSRSLLIQYVAELPKWVRVLPNTCSAIHPTPYGWLLRLNTIDSENKKEKYVSGQQTPENCCCFPLKCRACENSLLYSDAKLTSSIPVSSLGLSPNIEWHQMVISYFCHNHDDSHCNDNNQEKDVLHETNKASSTSAFTPKPNEVLVGLTSFIVNSKVIDPTAIIANFKDDTFRCARCHFSLGKITKEVLECSKDAVHIGLNCKKKLVADFLSDCSKNSRRLCISLKVRDNNHQRHESVNYYHNVWHRQETNIFICLFFRTPMNTIIY